MNVYNLSTTKFVAYHFDEREMAYHCNADRISSVFKLMLFSDVLILGYDLSSVSDMTILFCSCLC